MNSGMAQPQQSSFHAAAAAGNVLRQPTTNVPSVAPRFPAVVDPLTQAAVAQVGAVYQAAAAAAYKAVAASGLMPNLSQNMPGPSPFTPQPTSAAQPDEPGLYATTGRQHTMSKVELVNGYIIVRSKT